MIAASTFIANPIHTSRPSERPTIMRQNRLILLARQMISWIVPDCQISPPYGERTLRYHLIVRGQFHRKCDPFANTVVP